MKVLLTNDDGIYAPGLEAVCKELQTVAQVKVVAPEAEQSAVGHAITIYNPLRVTEIHKNGHFFGYGINGTPADCVKLGLGVIFCEPVDLVISGINLGRNAGDSIIYSGTVSAATEAIILGVPAIACSLATYTNPDFSVAAKFVRKLALLVHKHGLPRGTLLNVNVPAVSEDKIAGVAITRQGRFTSKDSFTKRMDPFQRHYYWLESMEIGIDDPQAGYDLIALKQNKISITPLKYDLTDYNFMENLNKWDISF